MSDTTIDRFARRLRACWGPLTTELIEESQAALADLLRADPNESWLSDLRSELPESRELYRDADHGFILLAHAEEEGRYRPPHDHGRSWVLYGVLDGAMEMRTYARIVQEDRGEGLVRRGTTLVGASQVEAYLPGDIHDTRCVVGPAIQFRFTARDLRHEAGMIRYADANGSRILGA